MGFTSLNLLGGNNEDRVEPNSDFFIINNDNVSSSYIVSMYVIMYYNSWRFLAMIQHTGVQFILFQKMLDSRKNTSIRWSAYC